MGQYLYLNDDCTNSKSTAFMFWDIAKLCFDEKHLEEISDDSYLSLNAKDTAHMLFATKKLIQDERILEEFLNQKADNYYAKNRKDEWILRDLLWIRDNLEDVLINLVIFQTPYTFARFS